MIKRWIKKLIVISILFFVFIPFKNVNAIVGDTDHRINYEVTSFEITDKGAINISGWSFIEHSDNYGGINLDTYIVAYIGTWNQKWTENLDSCKKDNKCLYYKTTPDTGDMYFVRCTNDACSLGINNYFRNQVKSNQLTKDGQTYSGSSTCTTDTFTYNKKKYSSSNSHCLYYQVGFKTNNEITIDGLSDKFLGKDVHFQIVSIVRNRNGKSGTKIYSDSSSLGIVPGACKSVYGQSCKELDDLNDKKTFNSSETIVPGSRKTETSTEIVTSVENGVTVQKEVTTTTETYDLERSVITIGGMSNQVQFTAGRARRYTEPYSLKKYSGYFHVDKGNEYHTVYDITDSKTYSNYKGDGTGTFVGRRYKLKEGNTYYYGWTSWCKSKGSLIISLKKESRTITDSEPTTVQSCYNFYCVGANCNYSTTSCNADVPTGITDAVSKNVSYNQCTSTDSLRGVSTSNFVSSDYYYRVSEDYIAKNFNALNIVTNQGSNVIKRTESDGKVYYYFPITFTVNVEFSQNANFEIVKGEDSSFNGSGSTFVNNMSVASGGYFNYAFNYNTAVTWKQHFAMNGNTGTSIYNTYNAIIKVPQVGSTEKVNVRLGLKKGETIYQLDSGNFSSVVYNLDLYKEIAKKSANSIYRSSVDFGVTFSDSYDSKKTIDNGNGNSNAGTLSCVSSSADAIWNEGVARTAQCSYRINQAYYKNNGTDYGRYVYDKDKATDENYTKSMHSYVYHIPLGLKKGDVFKFKVVGNEISIVNGINFSYDATCLVNVSDNGLNVVRYRPINPSDPFPKNIIPKNWQDYIAQYGLSRITNYSFSVVNYQTKVFDNSIKTIVRAYDDENTGYGYYGSFDDIDKNGSSRVVNDDLFLIRRGNYNRTGLYDPERDGVVS